MSATGLILIAWIIESSGALAKPVITFTPNWATILQGDSVTMTCEEASVQPQSQEYLWYRDRQYLQRSTQYVIQSAVEGHSDYQCRTNEYSEYSDPVRLDVRNVYVILQVPPSVHEGDDVSMRCHSLSGFQARNTEFYYKDRQIQTDGSDTYSIRNLNMSRAGSYQCKKQINSYGDWHDETSPVTYLSVKELFSSPVITTSPYYLIEGTDVTLTCYTDLSPFRPRTALQFAFYRNGNMVRDYDSSNTYLIRSATTEDSGDFTCEVETTNNRVKKKSDTRNLQVQALFSIPKLNVVPQDIAEGAAITLTCDTTVYYAYATQLLCAFYRDQEMVQISSSSNKYLIQSAKLENSGNYTCQVQTPNNKVQKTSQVSSIQIQERISSPQIKVSPGEMMTEGAWMNLTCETVAQDATGLLYAFYRNEEMVRGFSSSNKYLVPSTRRKDSGSYTCEVETSKYNVRKRSRVLSIQIQGVSSHTLQNSVRIGLSVCILITMLAFIIIHVKSETDII